MKKIFITTAALFAFGIVSAQTDTTGTTAKKKSTKVMTKSSSEKTNVTERSTNDIPGTQENPATQADKNANTTIPSGSAHGATGRDNGTGLERNESGSTGGTNVSKTATSKKKTKQ